MSGLAYSMLNKITLQIRCYLWGLFKNGFPVLTRGARDILVELSNMNPNKAISQTLAAAYAPCSEFQHSCSEMQWNPGKGHVPRGFAGGTGHLDEVELVLVFAEPGDPHDRESHTGIATAYKYATDCFKNGRDQFHRNVRAILNKCWPESTFEEQMRKVWLTDSVLCSARIECGQVSTRARVRVLSVF